MVESIAELTTLEEQHTSGAYPKRPLMLVKGLGSTVWDSEGNQYIDATSGQGVALLGHCHPAITKAIAEQAQTFITCPEIFYNDQRAELYASLSSVLPEEIGRFFLCNSGAEANEGALKVARLLTDREGIVATKRAFHGRTLGALATTWNKKYREPFAAWQPTVTHVTYNDLEAMREAVTDQTAAVIVEAVQGEGGVYPAEPGYLEGVQEICDETGALLIVDEIQTGFGRTGTWFAFQHSVITPDIITLGKGIAGGVPMGAVCWRSSLGEIPKGSHGSTFGGNPLACAAAIASINTMIESDLPTQVSETSEWLLAELNALDLAAVREIRGQGLLIGLELKTRVTPVLQALQDQGILALPAGVNVLRLLPPLTITRSELHTVITTLKDVLA